MYGATSTTDRFGNPNSAYLFNGVDNYIEIAHDAALNPASTITYTGWFQANSLTQVGNILSKGDGYTAGYYVARLHPAPINAGFAVMFTEDQSTSIVTSINASNVSLSVGQWYFFSVTYDGQTLRSYIDGVLKKQSVGFKDAGIQSRPTLDRQTSACRVSILVQRED